MGKNIKFCRYDIICIAWSLETSQLWIVNIKWFKISNPDCVGVNIPSFNFSIIILIAGIKIGPLTGNTRKIYIKKLEKLVTVQKTGQASLKFLKLRHWFRRLILSKRPFWSHTGDQNMFLKCEITSFKYILYNSFSDLNLVFFF